MVKKAVVGVIIAIVIIGVGAPIGFGLVQRMAVSNLKLIYDHMELTNIDFTDTETLSAAKRLVDQTETPSFQTLQDYRTLERSMVSPEVVALDLVANTNFQFSIFVKANNPSLIPVTLDRAQVKISVNDHELPNELVLSKQITIQAGGEEVIRLEGLTLSGRDVASVLYNFVGDNFVLNINFGITSYYPTIFAVFPLPADIKANFAEVPVPASINLKMYTIPQKPTLVGFGQPESAYLQQVAYGDRDESYSLEFRNNNEVPVKGKLQVGVLKGNILSGFGLCDPACLAPVDNGLATFIRIEGNWLFGAEVRNFENIAMSSGDQFTAVIHNPELRDNAKSAFIAKWVPDMDSIPYVVNTQISGVSYSSSGEFRTSTLGGVRNVVYLLSKDFGYVGSQQFVSPNYREEVSSSFSDTISDTVATFFASNEVTSTQLSLWAYSKQQNEWVSSVSAKDGEQISFSGYLHDDGGIGIANVMVLLRESDLLGVAWDNLGYGYTNEDGLYTIQWRFDSKQVDWDGDAELYAYFDGSSSYTSSQSSWVRVRSS